MPDGFSGSAPGRAAAAEPVAGASAVGAGRLADAPAAALVDGCAGGAAPSGCAGCGPVGGMAGRADTGVVGCAVACSGRGGVSPPTTFLRHSGAELCILTALIVAADLGGFKALAGTGRARH